MSGKRRAALPIGPVASIGSRLAVGAILLGLAAAVAIGEVTVRSWEASLAAGWLSHVISGGVAPSGTGFVLWRSASGPVLFLITSSCSVIVLIVPVLLLGIVMLVGRRTRPSRVLLGAAISAIALTGVSQLRLWIIAAATQSGGLTHGFEIAHVFIGSIVSIIGFACCVILLVRISTSRPSRRRLAS